MTDELPPAQPAPPRIILEYAPPPSNPARRGKGAIALFATIFLPGLGQMIAGERTRGFKWLAWIVGIYAAGAALLLWPALIPVGLFVLIGAAIAQLAGYVDAYRCGARSNRRLLGGPWARYGAGVGFLALAMFISPMAMLAVLYKMYFVEGFNVPTGAMSPTIVPEDRILTHKMLPIRRWDVVVFNMPTGVKYVKRLAGLPGETVEIRGNELFINDKPIAVPPEIHGLSEAGSNARRGSPLQIGPGEYFFLGDNSPRSADSRYWQDAFPGHPAGVIPSDQIIGRVTFTYWPIRRFGWIK